MLNFICMGSVQLRESQSKRKLQTEKLLPTLGFNHKFWKRTPFPLDTTGFVKNQCSKPDYFIIIHITYNRSS